MNHGGEIMDAKSWRSFPLPFKRRVLAIKLGNL